MKMQNLRDIWFLKIFLRELENESVLTTDYGVDPKGFGQINA